MNEEEILKLKEDSMSSFLETLQDGGVITESFTRTMLAKIEILNESEGAFGFSVHSPEPLSVYFLGERYEGITLVDLYNAVTDFSAGGSEEVLRNLFRHNFKQTASLRNKTANLLNHLLDWYSVRRSMANNHKLPPLPRSSTGRQEIRKAAGSSSYIQMWESGFLIDKGDGFASLADGRGGRRDYRDIESRVGRDVIGNSEMDGVYDDVLGLVPDAPLLSDTPIHMGRKGTDYSNAGRIAQKINDQELVAGELYTNITRIPRPVVFKWLNLFKKDVQRTGLSPESKVWKRVFLLGYQMDKKQTLEIWFNTLDSSFSVYDYFGNMIGNRYNTMNEAVRRLMLAAARLTPDDVDLFQNPADRSLAQSFFRPLVAMQDDYAQQVQARELKDYHKKLQDRKEEMEKARKEQEQEENDRINNNIHSAAATSRSNPRNKNAWAGVKSAVKAGVSKVKRAPSNSFDPDNDPIVQGAANVVNANKSKGAITGATAATGISQSNTIYAKHQQDRENLAKDVKRNEDNRDVNQTWNEMTKVIPNDQILFDAFRGERITTNKGREIFDYLLKDSHKNPQAFKTTIVNMMKGESPKLTQRQAQVLAGMFEEILRIKRSSTDENSIRSSMTRLGLTPNEINDFLGSIKKSKKEKVTESFVHSEKDEKFGNLNKIRDFNLEDDIADVEAREKEARLAMNSPRFNQTIADTRNKAVRSSASFQAIQKAFIGEITKYTDTRLNPHDTKELFKNQHIGDHATTRTVFDKVKKLVTGTRERADFHVGFNVNGRLYYEIWQITQMNPDPDKFNMSPTITGFFLFDVTSGRPRLIRANLPYLRNAHHALLQVISIYR